ncbi:MAG: chorismate synthase [Acidobacteria bacterium]|nr:chorismate synthase [Acidobacteriota bacterium]
MNSFGRVFRLHLFGESHGPAVGVVLDGCPAGLPLRPEDFRPDLARRKSGAPGTTARRETDIPEILSGVCRNRTTGAPVVVSFANADTRSGDYARFRRVPRPGQADFAAGVKFGENQDLRGGGHFSGRLTLGLVAAGVAAKKLVRPMRISARLVSAGGEADAAAAASQAARERNSIGGLVECTAAPVPPGLGEPFFDSLESLLAHILFAVPGIKGVEFGRGFAAASMRGRDFNDPLIASDGKTRTNNAGGINGGISNGNPVCFRVAARPPASIGLPQETLDRKTGRTGSLRIGGRHDACFALRLPVIVEAAAAVVFAGLLLLEQRIPRVWTNRSGRGRRWAASRP